MSLIEVLFDENIKSCKAIRKMVAVKQGRDRKEAKEIAKGPSFGCASDIQDNHCFGRKCKKVVQFVRSHNGRLVPLDRANKFSTNVVEQVEFGATNVLDCSLYQEEIAGK